MAFLRAVLDMAESSLQSGRFRKARSLTEKARELLAEFNGPLKERLDAEHILKGLEKRVAAF